MFKYACSKNNGLYSMNAERPKALLYWKYSY